MQYWLLLRQGIQMKKIMNNIYYLHFFCLRTTQHNAAFEVRDSHEDTVMSGQVQKESFLGGIIMYYWHQYNSRSFPCMEIRLRAPSYCFLLRCFCGSLEVMSLSYSKIPSIHCPAIHYWFYENLDENSENVKSSLSESILFMKYPVLNNDQWRDGERF